MAQIRLVLAGKKVVGTLSPAQEAIVVKALKRKYNYPVNVANPSFDPAQPAVAPNTQLIPNPVSAELFVAQKIVDELIALGTQQKAQDLRVVKEAEAITEANTAMSGITIVEDVAP